MKKYTLALLVYLVLQCSVTSQITVNEVGDLPEKVANNAVCEGFIGDVPYLFSFAGIDSTKSFAGIHLKSFRYNTETGESICIPDLPDTLGKIAASASRIGDVIYIIGGYHVFENGTELSSNKVHRYHIPTNTYLDDGVSIPVAIDDQVQCIWQDSLIYVVTGWSDISNVPDVQIYNPAEDSWAAGTPMPTSNFYMSFGASGVIVQDTIFFFGGASSGFMFQAQSAVRKGIINPNNPSEIEWSNSFPDNNIKAYRAAATTSGENMLWVGGSSVTYNYDGIAYNGSGGVAPTNRVLYTKVGKSYWNQENFDEVPMDLRGIAEVTEEVKFVAGGMLSGQEVSSKVYRIEVKNVVATKSLPTLEFSLYPNPVVDVLHVESQVEIPYKIYNSTGVLVGNGLLEKGETVVDVRRIGVGMNLILVGEKGEFYSLTFIKL